MAAYVLMPAAQVPLARVTASTTSVSLVTACIQDTSPGVSPAAEETVRGSVKKRGPAISAAKWRSGAGISWTSEARCRSMRERTSPAMSRAVVTPP